MAKTVKKDKAKESARSLYMTGKFLQKDIAEIVGVSARTIIRWVEEDKWDIILESITTSKEKRIAKYQRYLSEIESSIEKREDGKRIPTTAEIDQMTKLENNIKKLQDKASIAEIVNLSEAVCRFVSSYDLEKAKEVNNIFDAYIKTLL